MVTISKNSKKSSLRARSRSGSSIFSRIVCIFTLGLVLFVANRYYQKTFLKYVTDHGGTVETKTSSFDTNIFHALGQATLGDRKPVAVVYVDRKLTADMEGALQYLQKDLLQDNYVIPSPLDVPGSQTGTESLSNLVSYLKEDKLAASEITYMKFKAFLSRNKEENKNIILSSKDFADLDPQMLSDLLSPDFDVRIVMVYRRFYDRLFTKYYTDHKDDTVPYETFSDFAEGYEKAEEVSVGELYTKFKKTFDDVIVLETIEGEEISEAFFCNVVITDAPKSCGVVKDFFGTIVSLPDYGNSLEYQRILVEAQSRGLLTKDINMEEAMNALWKHETSKGMPKICSDVGAKIKKFTSNEEKLLFPEWSKFLVESNYDIFKENLCSIDTETVLKDDYWVTFIKNLDRTVIKKNEIEPEEKTAIGSDVEHNSYLEPETSKDKIAGATKVIIHVGPHFTGNNYIQAEAIRQTEQLNFDNFNLPSDADVPGFYMGTKAISNLALSLQNKEGFATEETLPKFKEFLARSQKENKNVLISSEEFAPIDPASLKEIVQDSEARIIIVHKRFFEWLEDAHFHMHKAKEEPYEPFVPWMKKNFNWKIMSASSVSSKYKEFFDDVKVIPFDDKKTLVTRFFCDGIPEASNTCANLKGSDVDHPYPGHQLAYHNLAVLGKAKGIINKGLVSNEVADKLADFVANKLGLEFHQLPTECFDDDFLEKVLEWSMNEEKTLLPEFFKEQGGDEGFKKAFATFKRDKACSLDTERIFEDEAWLEFMKSL